MKLLIIGHGRHGKDTVAEILRDTYGLRFQSSSFAAAELVARPFLSERGITYDTLEECYADRHNHRPAWHQAIKEYNEEDPTRLAREILKDADIYVGMRSNREVQACLGIFDLILWVDASERVPKESAESMNIDIDIADAIITNNEVDPSLSALRRRVTRLFDSMGYDRIKGTYIAGPMRGIPEFNFPAFLKAEQEFKAKGHDVFNPARRDIDEGFEHEGLTGNEDLVDLGFDLREAMDVDTSWICKHATGIHMLTGWENSKGARAELALAEAIGLEVTYEVT